MLTVSRRSSTALPRWTRRTAPSPSAYTRVVTETAPDLMPKTWYGMPAYADSDGKVVAFFQDAGKFKYRYCTLGFQDAANLDDGDMWPASFALVGWSPAVEKKVIALVKAAIRPQD